MQNKANLKQILKKPTHGLTIIYTGNGKGKTTASLGLALRAIKSNLKVLMIQFLKSNKASGEVDIPHKVLPQLKIRTFGKGFIVSTGRRQCPEYSGSPSLKEHKLKALDGLEYAAKMIKNKKYDIIILDEINLALGLKLIPQKQITNLIKQAKKSPKDIHLVLTGRGCPKSLFKHADLATEMKEVKHPFQQGYLAVQGIDY